MPNASDTIFAAYCRNRNSLAYSLYLVNPTDQDYERIFILTGAETGEDDYLIQSSKVLHGFGSFKKNSCLQIESDKSILLDFLIWFYVDLYKNNETSPLCTRFFLPKWYDEKKIEHLPILKKKGIKIELTERGNEPIIDRIKEIDFQPRSFEF